MKIFQTYLLLFLSFYLIPKDVSGQIVPKKYLFNQTFSYEELIQTYKALESKHGITRFLEYGKSDGGKPLHLFIIDADGDFSPVEARRKGKKVLFILNGIHAGEPDGIDASVEFAEELLLDGELKKLLKNVVPIIVPVYNVDGMLMRGTTRANQNGPEEAGFRATSRNLDLNRDCMKADSRNTRFLLRALNEWEPEFFVDTHVSNGADYRYIMTYIPTAPDKLEEPQKMYLMNELIPKLNESMRVSGYELAPYVNMIGETPESGITAFIDSPRYTTGLASLFGSIGFTTETHMLKPFPDRVKATKAFLSFLFQELAKNYDKIASLKKQSAYSIKNAEGFYLNHENDFSRFDVFLFKGYEAEYKPGAASGGVQIFYNRNKPTEKQINYYPFLRGKNFTSKPVAYLIPQAWPEIVEKLIWNGVKLEQLENDSVLQAEIYVVDDYKSADFYEGRTRINPTRIRTEKKRITASAGDYLVFMSTEKDKFIMSALEPFCKDSYFQWGFFNSVLEQKEHFSPYIFEETAAAMLKADPALREKMEDYFQKNPASDTPENRLNYLYQRSKFVEKTKGLYPIYRIMTP
jgi:hypothetical protein